MAARWMTGPSAMGSEKRSEEHTSELQSRLHLVCRLLLEKKKNSSDLHARLYLLHSFVVVSKQLLGLVHGTPLIFTSLELREFPESTLFHLRSYHMIRAFI